MIKIYLDNAATTKMDAEVLNSMLPFMKEEFGNPSSIHSFGRKTRTAIEAARKVVANHLNVSPAEIFFTSGGTEADNMAIVKAIETYNLNKIKDKEIIKLKLINARDFYKSIVNKFNISTDEFEKSYLLIFLQNHCFNGIYRENLKGEYNTPFNWEAKKIDKDKLTKKMIDIYSCFKQFNIAFSSVDFELIEKRDALIYLDPPYLNQDISENKYSKDLFGIEKQIKLINKIQDYSFIYSNHYDDRIIQKFSKFNTLEIINRKNTISSSNESRKNDKKEILITNLLIK
jgi:site-specific DNA-adenine methylase